MGIKLTTEQVTQRAKKVHGETYGYEKVNYKNAKVKIEILCEKHGSFWQLAYSHLGGAGCPECANDTKRGVQIDLIERFRKVHGNLYDYSKVQYKTSRVNIEIICPIHGSFSIRADTHLNGQGCPKCGNIAKGIRARKGNKYLADCVKTHGSRYDYSKAVFSCGRTPVKIICRVHGEFWQTPSGHINGNGCPECGKALVRSKSFIPPEVKWASILEVTGDTSLDFSHVVLTDNYAEGIICPVHGVLSPRPLKPTMRKVVCSKCSDLLRGENHRLTQEEFISKSKQIHGELYDYSRSIYTKGTEKVEILCEKHGSFWQDADSHLEGYGCPKCSRSRSGGVSKAETEISDYLENLGLEVVRSDRTILRPKELDIYLPELNIAIEYNGLIWHSEKFQKPVPGNNPARRHMLDKKKACESLGIRLIQINSDEPMEVIKKTLKFITGKGDRRVFARKCSVGKIEDKKAIKAFYDANHIQGAVGSVGMTYGLKLNGELLALMSFSTPSSVRGCVKGSMFELRRFSSCAQVVGGASKLLKAFLRDHPESTKVISYSDNRWFDGGMYAKLGFDLEKELSIDYRYTKDGNRAYTKNSFTHAKMSKREGFVYDPNLPEGENCKINGFYKVWDLGKKRWVLTVQ